MSGSSESSNNLGYHLHLTEKLMIIRTGFPVHNDSTLLCHCEGDTIGSYMDGV